MSASAGRSGHTTSDLRRNCVAIATVRDMLTFQRQATVADGVVRGRLCDAVNLGGADGCSGD